MQLAVDPGTAYASAEPIFARCASGEDDVHTIRLTGRIDTGWAGRHEDQ
jgi:hypothetical protein